MRIFLYEHVTSGGFIDAPLPPALVSEGNLMLQALANDLKAVPGTEVLIARDPRLPPLRLDVLEFPVHSKSHADRLFHHCCAMSDAVWPIAPESGGTLERLSSIVLNENRTLLGSSPAAVRITASKAQTALTLQRAGIAVVPTYNDLAQMPVTCHQVVIKPDDGAGCMNTRLLDRTAARQWWSTHKHDNDVVQPYIKGEALSLSLLCRDASVELLSCNRQQISLENDEFRFTGVSVNAIQKDRQRYLQLAEQVNGAIAGLWGYVGVDLIETNQGPVIVDVNPRVTTSYLGLHRALHCNPAAMVLSLLDPKMEQHAPTGGEAIYVGNVP